MLIDFQSSVETIISTESNVEMNSSFSCKKKKNPADSSVKVNYLTQFLLHSMKTSLVLYCTLTTWLSLISYTAKDLVKASTVSS